MSEPELYNDNELLRRISAGDELAFGLLVKQQWNTIYSHALAYLKSVEEAEETTQDIFLRLWKVRQTLTGITSLKDFLFIVARNQIYNEARKKIMRLYLPSDEMPGGYASPLEQTEYRDTYQLLLKGIEQLPDQRRKVFKMSRLDGMSNDQIASVLGMHKDTVYQYIVKAIGTLSQYMKDHQGEIIVILLLLGEKNNLK